MGEKTKNSSLKNELLKRSSGPKIGPFKGRLLTSGDKGAEVRPGMKGSFVDVEKRDIPTLGQLLDRFSEMGLFPTAADAIGGPVEAVAGVAPGAIKALRQRGSDILSDLRHRGLEKRSIGARPMKVDKLQEWFNTPWKERLNKNPPEDFYDPPTPLPSQMEEALMVAQERWPRLFGHVQNITDTDSLAVLNAGFGRVLHGRSGPISRSEKFSSMELNPKSAERFNDPDVYTNTVGHELLHAADRVSMGNEAMDKHYTFAQKLPGGYDANAMEHRARNMGDRMVQIVEETRKAGGPGYRERTGKNVRVPLTGNYAPEKPMPSHEPTTEDPLKKTMMDRLSKLFFGV